MFIKPLNMKMLQAKLKFIFANKKNTICNQSSLRYLHVINPTSFVTHYMLLYMQF
jgi:hypothetical protein